MAATLMTITAGSRANAIPDRRMQTPCHVEIVGLFGLVIPTVPTRRVFVGGLLFATGLLVIKLSLMALGKGVEGLHLSALGQPFLLPAGRALTALCGEGVGLGNRLVESLQETAEVLPFPRTEARLRGGDKSRPVLAPVLDQQVQSLGCLHLAGNQFSESASRLVKAKLGEIKQ